MNLIKLLSLLLAVLMIGSARPSKVFNEGPVPSAPKASDAIAIPPAASTETAKTAPAANQKTSMKQRMKQPVKELKKMAAPVEKAVTKTAQTAAKEVTEAAVGAHTLGGKVLQGMINVMIAASPGKTRVFLPAPSSDPNSGLTIGVLPVFLFVDQKEVVRHILAPSITYNKIFKMTTTMRYYWYPRPGSQFFALGSYALESNRRAALRYEDPHFYADWLYFKFDFNYQREGSLRFFGIGPDSPESNQTNYMLRELHVQQHLGVNFLERFRFVISHRFRAADVVDGPIGSLPQISQFRPVPIGVGDTQTTVAQRFTLSYDSRDLPVAPVRGHYASVFGEIGGRYMGGDSKFTRVGADLRGFYPVMDNRFVTGWRLTGEEEDGDKTPFYEQSLLGGKDSLRGFGEARFVDRKKASISLEERIRMYTLKAFNVNIDFEVTPFYEAGEVFHHNDSFMLSQLKHVGGVGFRTVVRPNVVGVIDIGFSEEGTALFVGIDYPF